MEPLQIDTDPQRRNAFGPRELELERLLNAWDPIGVYGIGIQLNDGATLTWPDDEYDDLVRPLIGALRDGANAMVLEQLLDGMIAEDYGIAAPLSITLFCEQVYTWWQAPLTGC